MMDCSEVEVQLYAYLDRELDPREQVEVRLHLERCQNCFQLVQFESGVVKLVRRKCSDQAAPSHLREQIRAILYP